MNTESAGAPASPPLICHIIYRLAIGGLENGLVNLINNLPTGSYRHAIVCVTSATEFRNRIRNPDIEIYEIHKRLGKDIAAYGRMWRVLKRLKPTIVHTRNLPALDMIVPAALAGVPRFVHSEHGLDLIEIDGQNFRYNWLRRLSRILVDRYITVSNDLNRWLRHEIGVPESRIETIYNGVDTDRFSPPGLRRGPGRDILPAGFAPDGAIVIGTIGRLDPLKNQLGLVEAFLHVLETRPALRQVLRLVIVGDGYQRPEIEAALIAGKARDLAWLPGFRDDTPNLYRSLDIFVLPSLREGISNTLLEAMASGRPVIATRVGGNPEIVPEGKVGQLVPPDPLGLAAAIVNYLDHPELMRAHGEGGRTHVLQNFSLQTMVSRYDKVYQSLL
ncbi:MAG: TIGR03088 family PEP-CTERM/XrtA system glycosyltransferase [Alphaproteobacteria bacterium]